MIMWKDVEADIHTYLYLLALATLLHLSSNVLSMVLIFARLCFFTDTSTFIVPLTILPGFLPHFGGYFLACGFLVGDKAVCMDGWVEGWDG